MDAQLSFNQDKAAVWLAAYISYWGLAGVVALVLGLFVLLIFGIPYMRNHWGV